MGLNVTAELPPAIHEMMDLYPQPQRGRPSVEYVPMPYHPPQGEAPLGDRKNG